MTQRRADLAELARPSDQGRFSHRATKRGPRPGTAPSVPTSKACVQRRSSSSSSSTPECRPSMAATWVSTCSSLSPVSSSSDSSCGNASTGQTSVLSFYGRRCRQIIPGATVVIVVTVAASYALWGRPAAATPRAMAVGCGLSGQLPLHRHGNQLPDSLAAPVAPAELLAHGLDRRDGARRVRRGGLVIVPLVARRQRKQRGRAPVTSGGQVLTGEIKASATGCPKPSRHRPGGGPHPADGTRPPVLAETLGRLDDLARP